LSSYRKLEKSSTARHPPSIASPTQPCSPCTLDVHLKDNAGTPQCVYLYLKNSKKQENRLKRKTTKRCKQKWKNRWCCGVRCWCGCPGRSGHTKCGTNTAPNGATKLLVSCINVMSQFWCDAKRNKCCLTRRRPVQQLLMCP
jgi:hypothetical protein